MKSNMNLFSEFENKVREIVENILPESDSRIDFSGVSSEFPRDDSHGDLAINAAMVLARQVGIAPRRLAEMIALELEKDTDINRAIVAGPGFINIILERSFWTDHLFLILQAGCSYGAGFLESEEKVNVEYVSANPTGPLHVGHCRGAVLGDVLANLLEFFGYDVTREYYVNDAGEQVNVLAHSLYLRYREALGEDIGKIPEGLYPGEYLIAPAKKLVERYGDKLLVMEEKERIALVRPFAVDEMMQMIRKDLDALRIRHDVFFSENRLHTKIDGVSKIDLLLQEMRERDFIHEGKLPPPKGQLPQDWEDRKQTLFKATAAGDDMDRPLIKSDGSFTYFAADMAYFRDKFERGFKRTIYILGADHGGYVKRLEAVARAVAGDRVRLDTLMCQLVTFMREGKPVQMSKRSGNFITLREVVDEVGRDAVRFMMLYRSAEAPIEFDFHKVMEHTRDNPLFYVQYAYARICSVFRQAAGEMKGLSIQEEDLERASLDLLSDEGEIGLIKKVSEYPMVIERSARLLEPHRLVFYLNELAARFHSHWNCGKAKPELRFINPENAQLTLARLAVLRVAAQTLASGLTVVGVSAPEEMR